MSFKEKYMEGRTKELSLPSNPEIKVRIKKMSYRSLIVELQKTTLLTTNSLKYSENNDNTKMDPKAIAEAMAISNLTLVKGMISPRVTLEATEDENELCIDDIDDKDYNFLVAEITGFSKEVQKSLQTFRKVGDPFSS